MLGIVLQVRLKPTVTLNGDHRLEVKAAGLKRFITSAMGTMGKHRC